MAGLETCGPDDAVISCDVVTVGARFGLLTVTSISVKLSCHRAAVVRCSCGIVKIVRIANLLSGQTVSCGHKRTNRKHRDKRTYNSWMAMQRRCLDPKFTGYENYGGRGIEVCERWRDRANGYDRFVEDMGVRPPGMTLDRRDVNGNYEPSNCKWSTRVEQGWNKRQGAGYDTREEWEYWQQREEEAESGRLEGGSG